MFEMSYELVCHEFGDHVMDRTKDIDVNVPIQSVNEIEDFSDDDSDTIYSDKEEEEDTEEYLSELEEHFEGCYTLTIGPTQLVHHKTVRES